MKNATIFGLFALLMLSGSVFAAVEPSETVQVETIDLSRFEMDTLCQSYGYDYGVAQYVWHILKGKYVIIDDVTGHGTKLRGTPSEIDWAANPAVDAVITIEGNGVRVHDGGSEGSVEKHSILGMGAVTFCANTPEVPEFGTVLMGVLAFAGIGLIAYKRK